MKEIIMSQVLHEKILAALEEKRKNQLEIKKLQDMNRKITMFVLEEIVKNPAIAIKVCFVSEYKLRQTIRR